MATVDNADPGVCPHCGSSNLRGGSFTVDGDECGQPVDCGDCGAEWVDVYTFSGRTA